MQTITFGQRFHQFLHESLNRLRQPIGLSNPIVERAMACHEEAKIDRPKFKTLGFGGEWCCMPFLRCLAPIDGLYLLKELQSLKSKLGK